MRRDRQFGWVRGLLGAVALSVTVTLVVPAGASAQCAGAACTTVRPDGKGIIGLGLIGAELGLIIPALAGVRDEWWPYLVFPLLGAIGGGIGGWAVEQATPNDAEIDVALMAIGMVLIVPTIVGTLALTAYQPPETAADSSDEDYEPANIIGGDDSVEAVHDDSAPAGEFEEGSSETPSSETPSSGSSGATSRRDDPAARMRAMMAGGRGLLRFDLGGRDGDRMMLGAPMIYSASSYTAEERARLLLNAQNDLIIPVVSATF